MKKTEKETTQTEANANPMREICEKCGHHNFCKYEIGIDELVKQASSEIERADIHFDGPFALSLQCMGFCQTVQNQPDQKK